METEKREKIRKAIEGQLNVADNVGWMSNYNIAQMILVELEMYHNAESLWRQNEEINIKDYKIETIEILTKEVHAYKLFLKEWEKNHNQLEKELEMYRNGKPFDTAQKH